MPFLQVVQAALVLTGAGHLHPAQKPLRQAQTRCAALNRHLCERARINENITFLASPVTASGISVSRTQQLYLLAAHNGRETPNEQARFVWDIFSARGQRVVKDGKALETSEENLDELSRQAAIFTEKSLPVLNALGVTL